MNNTENKAEIKIEQSTDSDMKSVRDFNQQFTIPVQWEHVPSLKSPQTAAVDFCEIKGQYLAKRALEIAAAGSHHTMLIGPTGSGKTMFIKAFPSILPDISKQEIQQTTAVYASLKDTSQWIKQYPITRRPIRFPTPHNWNNSEILMAYNGVLVMDELLQFKTSTLEYLRKPMDDYPFMLLTALNLPDKNNKKEWQRFKGCGIFSNGQMDNRAVIKYCKLDSYCEYLMKKALEKLDLSARIYFKTLKVSRTIADLKGCDQIQRDHVQEALHYVIGEVRIRKY